MPWSLYAFSIIVGSLLSLQIVVNARLKTALQNPIAAALVSFLIGTAALVIYLVIQQLLEPKNSGSRLSQMSFETISATPWWAWIGGLLGAIYVASATVLGPRLGSASLLSLIVCGQLLTSLVIDHYALLGFPVHSMNPSRWVGALLLTTGMILIVKN